MDDARNGKGKGTVLCYFMGIVLLAVFAGTALGQDSCVAPPTGIVSWWGGENNALDLVGGNNGTAMNGVTYAVGMVERAFSFDGTDDYVSVPSDPSLDPTVEATLEAWVYFNQLPSAAGHIMEIMAKSGFGTDLDFLANTNDKVYFYVGAGVNVASTTVIQAGQWYHIACVYKAADRLQIFINGVLDNGIAISVTRGTNSNPFTLGAAAQWPGRYFNGILDEATIYNRALPADEIAAIFAAGSDGKCRSCSPPPLDLISWWKGEDDGMDSFGENHGTLQGGIAFADGAVGMAFSLNGYPDSVTIPKIAAWDFGTSSFSVTAWFKTSVSSGYKTIIRYDNGSNNGLWALNVIPGGQATFAIYDYNRAGNSVVTPLAYNDGYWHLAVGVRDAPLGKLKIYIDGILVNEIAEPGRNVVGAWNAIPAIGKCGSYNGEYFPGMIDEVAVFHRALTPDDVVALFNAGSAGLCPPDTVPDAFFFTDQSGVAASTVITSGPITVSGTNYPSPVSIPSCGGTDCQYSINGGEWTSGAGSAAPGDSVTVRQTSSGSPSTQTDLTLDIGGVSDLFSVTTQAEYELSVTKPGTGSGTVTSSPPGIDCGSACSWSFVENSEVALTAASDPASYFVGWNGDCFACMGDPACTVTMSTGKSCGAVFDSGPPGEASREEDPMMASRGTDPFVEISYIPANCATDHAVYWGSGPIGSGLIWLDRVCGLGSSGSASFNPGDPAPGHFLYFVVVGANGSVEGSYGKDSNGDDRVDADDPGVECFPQELENTCP